VLDAACADPEPRRELRHRRVAGEQPLHDQAIGIALMHMLSATHVGDA
jgi:hypothetical protein